ncbi:MAG: endonuclease, partial [Muribaculaceae bacterium]|nr:endonuclease [Muribaculaceae bacterium]
MKYRSVFLTLATALAALSAGAAIPAGYYDACKGKSKGALKSQLYTIVKNHNAISYGDATWRAFKSTDVRDGKYWWDIYTDANVNISGNSSMNIEHSFPKSWWGGGKNDAYRDIVHLMPVNANANNLRNNYPFAEVETEKSYKQQVPSPRFRYGYPKSGQGGNATYVFEPDDEYKGDLARTYFYMVTCYQNLTWSGNGTYTAAQNTYPTLQPWAQEMLLRWHREDPVSQKELDRNEGVYREQGNRNPFIDHPEMVEHIWGDRQNQGWATVDPDPDPDP